MNTHRARLMAGAAAVCATIAVAPAIAGSDPTPAAQAATAPAATAAVARTHTSVWVKRVRRNVLTGRTTAVTGKLQPRLSGRIVRLQVRSAHGWRTVDRAITKAGGVFALRYRPASLGTLTLRVAFTGDRHAFPSHRSAGRVNVFRQAMASWYNLVGSPLACGGRLGADQLGVANKTLPCGTKITLRYRGRSVQVKVIDRGPYVAGRDYDLTGATKRALGFGDLGTVLATR